MHHTFRSSGGVPRGFDWVGWKRSGVPGGSDPKSPMPEHLNLVFSFDQVRTFDRVVIHANNHFTKDIQIFSEAKVYFSNEEDKFGDDRYYKNRV